MKLPRRTFLHLAAGAAALPALPRIAWAQAYPARPVRIIVGFPAGGPGDIVTRLMGQWLSERLGQPFIVENRAGAAGNIGTATLYDKLNSNLGNQRLSRIGLHGIVHAHCGAVLCQEQRCCSADAAGAARHHRHLVAPFSRHSNLVGAQDARLYAWSINCTARAQSCTLIGGAAPRPQWSSASRSAVK